MNARPRSRRNGSVCSIVRIHRGPRLVEGHRLHIALALTLTLSATPLQAGWVDSWLAQKTETPAGYFEGQKRGYVTGGALSARWRTGNLHPMSISMPRLSSGCGGIDLFGGGFTFTDPEYLVQQFQRLIQAAPAIAFDLALSELAKELGGSMKQIKALIDRLNALQINDCRMANRLVSTVQAGDYSSILSNMWAEVDQGRAAYEAESKSWTSRQEEVRSSGGKPDKDLNRSLESCPQELRDVFQPGSLVANVAQRSGMGAYADILRGYVGDVRILAGNVPDAQEIAPCEQNRQVDGADFLDAEAWARPADGGECRRDSNTKLFEKVRTQVESIASKMKTKGALSAEETRLIDSAPVQLLQPIAAGLASGASPALAADQVAPLLASAYAQRAVEDLYHAAGFLVDRGLNSLRRLGVANDADAEKCRQELTLPVQEKAKALQANTRTLRLASKTAYHQAAAALIDQFELAILQRQDALYQGRRTLRGEQP